MRFRFGTRDANPARTLVVDGFAEGFDCLSHWPGARVPAVLRHDLSTGMALRLAALPPERRLELLGPFDQVANTHYDTDGVLSVACVMRPDDCLPRAESLLDAAATGDFARWSGERALAVELTLAALPRHPDSPLAAALPTAATDEQRWERAYLWAIEHVPALIDEPFAWRALWEARHAVVCADVARVEAGDGVSVEHHDGLDFAVVTTTRPLAAIALHHAAGPRHRLLVVQPGERGSRYRFCYRSESWFNLVSCRPAPRRPLRAAIEELQQRERAAGSPGDARWWADKLDAPVVQLGFGDPERDRQGFFLDPLPHPTPPSRLSPASVEQALVRAFEQPSEGQVAGERG